MKLVRLFSVALHEFICILPLGWFSQELTTRMRLVRLLTFAKLVQPVCVWRHACWLKGCAARLGWVSPSVL